MVRDDWITRVYQSMGVPEKVVNITVKLMEGSKTRLEVTEEGKVLTSGKNNTRKRFLRRQLFSGRTLSKESTYFIVDRGD